MATVYVRDNLIFKIKQAGQDKQAFIREAIQEKLCRDFSEVQK